MRQLINVTMAQLFYIYSLVNSSIELLSHFHIVTFANFHIKIKNYPLFWEGKGKGNIQSQKLCTKKSNEVTA